MTQNIIALIFDFDITLAPQFQQQVLFDRWGIEADEFWKFILPQNVKTTFLKI